MIDITKKYKTRIGQTVRLISADGCQPFPVVGYVGWNTLPSCWTADGQFCRDILKELPDSLDLVEVPEELSGWVNVYGEGHYTGCRYEMQETKQKADQAASDNRIACIEIKFRKGEGLND